MRYRNFRIILSSETKQEIENLNKPVTIQEIETVIKSHNYSNQNSPSTKGLDGFMSQFYQTFKGKTNTYAAQTLSKN